jgi:hypothetical protein
MPTLYWGPWLAKIRRGGPAKCLFGVFNSPKNEHKQFDLRYHSSKVEFVQFFGELKIPKRHFEIN